MTLKEITATPFALPEDVLAVLEENSRVVGFKKNELIIRAGDVDVPFYFIKSGLARIFYTPLSTPPPPGIHVSHWNRICYLERPEMWRHLSPVSCLAARQF